MVLPRQYTSFVFSIFFFFMAFFAIASFHSLPVNAQSTRYCSAFTVSYGDPLPASTDAFESKEACEAYFQKNCTPDGSIIGQGGYCCLGNGTFQKGNNVYCGKSTVVATTCTVGGNTLTAGATACGSSGDAFEYVCVANGSAVGSANDDTGTATLQKRTCSAGWTCQGNACVAQNNTSCSLPHGTLDARANMFCCSGKYSSSACSGAQGYYLGGTDLPDGTWCTPGDSNLFSGSGGCGRCASKKSELRTDGKYYCGAAPRVYCNKICSTGSSCTADSNGGVCRQIFVSATPVATPNLQVDLMYTGPKTTITRGQPCNNANGCICVSQSSLSAPTTTLNKGDICGGASLPAGSVVCTGQCVSGTSCGSVGEQKGIGACTSGFVCCGTSLQAPGLTAQQSACIRNYNQTGLITQDGACAQTLVSQNIVSQQQVIQTAGQQAITDFALKTVVASVEGAASTFEKSQILGKAYTEGKISLQEYAAASAYYGVSMTIDLATGGAETQFQTSLTNSRQECAKSDNGVNCALATIGAGANGFIAVGGTFFAVDQIVGSPVTNTLLGAIPNKVVAANEAANAAENATITKFLENKTVSQDVSVLFDTNIEGNLKIRTDYIDSEGIAKAYTIPTAENSDVAKMLLSQISPKASVTEKERIVSLLTDRAVPTDLSTATYRVADSYGTLDELYTAIRNGECPGGVCRHQAPTAYGLITEATGSNDYLMVLAPPANGQVGHVFVLNPVTETIIEAGTVTNVAEMSLRYPVDTWQIVIPGPDGNLPFQPLDYFK